ncbi:hypothetical protein ABXS75_19600 [Roseburia hominis]
MWGVERGTRPEDISIRHSLSLGRKRSGTYDARGAAWKGDCCHLVPAFSTVPDTNILRALACSTRGEAHNGVAWGALLFFWEGKYYQLGENSRLICLLGPVVIK